MEQGRQAGGGESRLTYLGRAQISQFARLFARVLQHINDDLQLIGLCYQVFLLLLRRLQCLGESSLGLLFAGQQ